MASRSDVYYRDVVFDEYIVFTESVQFNGVASFLNGVRFEYEVMFMNKAEFFNGPCTFVDDTTFFDEAYFEDVGSIMFLQDEKLYLPEGITIDEWNGRADEYHGMTDLYYDCELGYDDDSLAGSLIIAPEVPEPEQVSASMGGTTHDPDVVCAASTGGT
jgi:hypothetical protein